ncbi:sensor histidine kinase [Nonomuraea sp. NPDC049649]|uniref:sensor histidine kinase n=1 Tax=Nonomuraea sp. NPDC049649 TaxID=3155776 RepID=UPI003414244F
MGAGAYVRWVAGHGPVAAGAAAAVLAVGETAVRAAGTPPLTLAVLFLVGLATTVPLALLPGQPAVAAVIVTGSVLLSLTAFQTLTLAGAAAQLFCGYRLGRHGSWRLAVLLAVPFPLVAVFPVTVGEQVPAHAQATSREGPPEPGLPVPAHARATPQQDPPEPGLPVPAHARATSREGLPEPGLPALVLGTLAPAAALAGTARRAHADAAVGTAERQEIAGTLLEHTARGERARIARELHDVVAHHISMVAVQAESARLAVPGMPAAGAERLAAIGDTARAALTEMRRLLGVLREDDEAERRPQPGLTMEELIGLADEAREASGAAVRLVLSGRPVPLDPGVELAAYRIVQEALTNARRHAPGAAVDVELHYSGDGLRLLVRDNGGAPPAAPDGGFGLAGMRERAAAAGGELRAGPVAGGGFLVEARLPGEAAT